MKPIIIIVIALGLVVASLAGYSILNQDTGMNDAEPWVGLSCDEMLDFSASDGHQLLTNDQHMEFHNYYFDRCSESGKP